MEKVIVKKLVPGVIEKEVTMYKTSDGKEYSKESAAKDHETLKKAYPKLSDYDVEFIERLEITEDYENLLDMLKTNNVIILVTHSGGDMPFFAAIEPKLAAVEAVIKFAHRRSVGCNCNWYVDGVVYKGESLCFNDGKNDGGKGYYTTGVGRNIKEVLSDK